jgi:DinB family protein
MEMASIQKHADLPATLQAILDDLDRSELEARRVASSVSEAQANWRPSESSWSIAQCIDHLARTNTFYAKALLEAIRKVRPLPKPFSAPIRPGWLSGPFIRQIEPPPSRRFRAPKVIVPAALANKEEALDAFLESHNDVRAAVREGAVVDLNRVRFRNPFIHGLRFTAGAGLLIVTAHERRHLWQAEQVRRAVGFPEG